MNEALKGIFDNASLDAIKNADKISPSPEYYQGKQGAPQYAPAPQQPRAQMQPIQVSRPTNSTMIPENREILVKLEAQKELIRKIIASQNEMIKEFNALQEKVGQMERRAAAQAQQIQQSPQRQEAPRAQGQSAPSHPTATDREGKQQTGAAHGLNPNDFKVENIFYMGNKK